MQLLFKCCLYIALLSFSFSGFAQNMSIIRDSETEDFLYDLTRPIFKAADLNPDNIKIYIVNDSSINAFVFGGQNVFINSGLITKYYDADVLVGVVAHEVGHIAAGHLARSGEVMSNMNSALILSYLVGIAAAVTTSPDLGYAVMMGGNQVAGRLALKYNRGQEEAADRLALLYLDKSNYPADGLLRLLQFFNSEQIGYQGVIDEYALTHPTSQKRVDYIKANLDEKHDYDRQLNLKMKPRLKLIIAKLTAFLEDPDKILTKYNNNNPDNWYARSIAYFKKGDIKKSLQQLDYLINNFPNDGYLWELKGQILFESGFIKDSIISYQKAVKLQNRPYLAKIALAQSIITLNSGDKDLTDFAIDNLLDAKLVEKNNPDLFKQLAKAYSQNKNKGRAYLALAELNLLQNDEKKTLKYAKLAKEELSKDDKEGLIKADDIITIVKKKDKTKKKDR